MAVSRVSLIENIELKDKVIKTLSELMDSSDEAIRLQAVELVIKNRLI